MKCTFMNCVEPVYSHMALICEKHRQWRVGDCAEMRSHPNYAPSNPMCTHSMHREVFVCRAPAEIHWAGIKCQPCTECHYCGQVHPFRVAVA